MKITNIAIARYITVFAMVIIVIVAGITAYRALPREANPEVKIPFVMVYAPYYGTSPSDMENVVTRKIETQLKALPDLVEMSSVSSEGVATIVLEFTTDAEMIDVLQKVRDAVELAKPDLPQDVKDDILVYELSSDDWPIMQVVMSGPYDPVLLKQVAEDLQEDIEQVRGVISVDLSGGVEREVQIDVEPARLEFFGLGLVDVQDAIALENVTIPGGELSLGTYDYQVRVPGEFTDVDEILDIVLNPGEANPVYMRDVADVTFGIADAETASRLNGVDAVTLSVKKRSGENVIVISDAVHALVDEQMATFPPNTEVKIINDQSVYVRDMVTELENNILSGLILVVVVLFLFLGLANSLFVGVAIPLSMLISFMVLRYMGITLNMVVLFSLILALGMLVDNAIVIVENIYRHMSNGKSRVQAASEATHEVSSAVIASTLTTVAAFGPLIFWPGIMGEFMKYLPITLVVTLLSSLLVALVVNPVLCSRFMRVPPQQVGRRPRPGDRLMAIGLRSYRPVLRWTLGHRGITMGAMSGILVASFVLFGMFNAGVELFPDVDPTYAYVRVNAPSGTRLEVSDGYTQDIESKVKELPDLKAYVTEVGAAAAGDGSGSESAPSHLSLISIEFEKKEDREANSRQALEDLRTHLGSFTGAKLYVEKQEGGPPTGKPVNIEISGKDFLVLGEIAERVKDEIRDIPGVVDLQDDYDRGRPEIRVRPDLDKAARFGLRTVDVASTIRTALHGDDISKFRVGEDEYDIVVRHAGSSRRSVEDIEQLTVFYEGTAIPLTAFADVSYTTGLGAITRIDGRRVVTVSSDVSTDYNGNAVLAQVQKRLQNFDVPRGYHLDFTGESEDQEEAQAFLSEAFFVVIGLIGIILITLFTSLTTPLVIVFSVMLSLIGVFLGLTITQTPFGIIMTGVGVISLAGIVVNNAIVLVDYIIKLRNSGMEITEAIVEAGETRFRPVVLTAVTTILGLIPLSTGASVNFGRLFSGDFGRAFIIGGESSQWWGPMGVAVIWGLAVATFLTLVVVPVMYSGVESMKLRSAQLIQGLFSRSNEPLDPARSEG
jgi:multidrug efflux pump subunit AcrB